MTIRVAEKYAVLFAVLFGWLLAPLVSAEVDFDFQPDTAADPDKGHIAGWPGSCNFPGFTDYDYCHVAGAFKDPDTTPFLQEAVKINNIEFWHLVVGDPADGFSMDMYIPMYVPVLSDSGGRPSNFPEALYTKDLDVQSGNGWDPLGMSPETTVDDTGNGTGDPRKVIMRQILGGTWNSETQTWSCEGEDFCLDFIKSEFSQKPKIFQVVNDADQAFVAYFEMDMSNSNYIENIAAQHVVNTVDVEGTLGDADVMEIAEQSVITGGKYTYRDGYGWRNTGTGDRYRTWDFGEGTYNYDSGEFDYLSVEWSLYYDPRQNPYPGSGNEGKCDSGAIAGTCPY